ncbi:MAG: hypothetical protein JG769_263 [Oscillospiraceae bacterium]|jgi:hypothetical protein|nr:hypothetical protein [Oscillospiraceae bacterium]
MITKINAELDSIETAELAARMIKQKTDGILSIKIERKDKSYDGYEYEYANSLFFPYMNGFLTSTQSVGSPYTGNAGFFYPDEIISSSDGREISKSVIIDVICEKEAESTVTQVFTSLGGLKINKN